MITSIVQLLTEFVRSRIGFEYNAATVVLIGTASGLWGGTCHDVGMEVTSSVATWPSR